jgi:hypothetical protein
MTMTSNENDPDWAMTNPAFHIEAAMKGVTEAINQIDNSGLRNILWWVLLPHLTGKMMERFGYKELSKRLLEVREENKAQLFDDVIDLRQAGKLYADDNDGIVTLFRRMEIDWPLGTAE